MITIVTGVPGSAKTLWVVDQIVFNSDYKDRPTFIWGIDGFNFQSRAGLFPLDDPVTWNDLPAHSVIVFDEAQGPFPIRSSSKAPPKFIEDFSTHRHKGYDIFLTSQHPTMVDGHLLKNCGRHLHFLRFFGLQSSTIFEWPEYRTDNVNSSTRRKMSISKRWRFPKRVFGLYKSAEVHTHKRSIPWKVWSIPLFFIVAALVVWFFIHTVSDGSFASLGHKSVSSVSAPVPFSPSSVSSVHRWVSPSPSSVSSPAVPQLLILGTVSSGSRFDFVVDNGLGGYILVPRAHCVLDDSNWSCMVGGARASLLGSGGSSSSSASADASHVIQ